MFIDESTKTRRCGPCAHAAMIIAVTEDRINRVQNGERIQSQKKRLELLSKHIHEVNPELLKWGGAAAPKSSHRSEAARQSLARSVVVNGSKNLRSLRMGICLGKGGGKLTFDTKCPSKFHRDCRGVWLKTPDGRIFMRS